MANSDALIQQVMNGDPRVAALVGMHALAVLGEVMPEQQFTDFVQQATKDSAQAANSAQGPQPGTDSPEGLGAMMAKGHPDGSKVYGAMKQNLPLHQMDRVEGGVIGRIFSDNIGKHGTLNAPAIGKALGALPAETKKELWGTKPQAIEGVQKFADCMAELQRCRKQHGASPLTDELTITHDGPQLNGASKITIPWRYLANPQIVTRLTAIADRSYKAADASYGGKYDRSAVIKAMQQNGDDAQKIHAALGSLHARQQMSQVK